MSASESQAPDTSHPSSDCPPQPLNNTPESQQRSPPAAAPTNKRKKKRFWERWGLTLPQGGALPWLSNDFYWITNKLGYKGYCMKVLARCPTIDRKNMEMAWAQFCLLKARQMRRKSVKTEEDFEKLSEKLSRAIYQIEGYEGFDVVTFWATHRTIVEIEKGIEVGIQSDFDYAAVLLPQEELMKSVKHEAKELNEILQKELLDTRLTEEEKFGFELGDIEEGVDGMLSSLSNDKGANDDTKYNDADDEEDDEEDDDDENEDNERENASAKRKRGEERAPDGHDEKGNPYWEFKNDVYEDDDSDLDNLPEETEPSAPKRQKLSENLLKLITPKVLTTPESNPNSPSSSLPLPVSQKTSKPDTGTDQNRSSMASPSRGHRKSNHNRPTISPRPPRAPKNMSEANATPLGSRPSLPPLPHTLRNISQPSETPLPSQNDVLDAFDALSVRPPSSATK